nr:hypothetical protein [Tanacetum cinerariifolium]
MHKAFPLLGIEFPLAKEVPTASEEGCHCQKKREATVRKIALLSKSRRNRKSKSNDNFTNFKITCNPSENCALENHFQFTSLSLSILIKKWINNISPLPKYQSWIQENLSNGSSGYNNIFNKSIMPCGSKYKTAQELWATILKTFDGNEATKKTKKNLLKQQYGNFKAKGSETLEQAFKRLQVIVGQLQFMDVEINQDDLNQKFLTSLALEWRMHTIVWRNMSDLDTMSLDDLYNHLKVASISQDTACAYIASQSSSSQIKFEDINQIDEDDMDIKWSMALLSMRADKAPKSQDKGRRDNYKQGFNVKEQALKALMEIDGVGWDWSYMANDEEDHALVAVEEAPTEFALMANTSTESKVFDNSLCSKDCKKNNDSLNSMITDLTDKLFDAKNMIYHYKLGLAKVESRLVEHKDREIKYCEKIRGLEFRTKSNNECIEILKKKLEILNKEKEGVDRKLAGFLTASKDL